MDLISVTVVTYNSSNTIIETLESIKKQTYPKLELIVSDDASTDDTVCIVKEWAKKNRKYFFKIRILVGKKNHGVVKNCNMAIYQARGIYVQEMAGDDLLTNDAIEEKYRFAQSSGMKLVYSKVEPFGSSRQAVNNMKRYCERSYKIITSGWECQNDYIVVDNFIAAPAGGFFDRKYFLQMGGYDIRFPMLEDYPFYYRYITEGNEIVLLDKILLKYRVSEQSLTGSKNVKLIQSIKKFFYLVR
ncbi:MAG: glycosyltransferase, partial [Clostridium sp.]|nr:glycosyltransferase [Clostridium sp.]